MDNKIVSNDAEKEKPPTNKLSPNNPIVAPKSPFPPEDYTPKKLFKDIRATILVDLSKTIEEIWQNIDRSRRKNVNKAIRLGLVFRKADENDLKYYHENIYKKVWESGGANAASYEYWLNMIKTDFEFYVVELNSKIIGGAVAGGKILNRFSFAAVGSDPDYYDYRATDLMYWELIKIAKSRNFKVVDFSGYQLNARGHTEGVNRFKSMWGGFLHTDYIYSNNPFWILGRKAFRNIIWVRNMVNFLKGRKEAKKEIKKEPQQNY